ncbi:hypothetical protein F5B17DRAFT_433001 [Nemania serpens]|nr:hypothetical protein F5B17DRAFT_433001 [Nemania serpens]
MSRPVERSSREGLRSTSPILKGYVKKHSLMLLRSQEDIPSGPPFPKVYVEKTWIEPNLDEPSGSEFGPIPRTAPSFVDSAPRAPSSTEPIPKGFIERCELVPLGSQEARPSGPPFPKRYVERTWIERNPDESLAPQQDTYLPSTAGWSAPPGDPPSNEQQVEAEAPQEYQGNIPITDLETDHLRYRILILPRDPENFKHDPARVGTFRLYLRSRAASSLNAVAVCFATVQHSQESDYAILAPLRCRLYYDSQSDFIAVKNEEPTQSITLGQVIDSSTSQERPANFVLEPYTLHRVAPGAWSVRSSSAADGHAFQFTVYPRTCSFSILQKITLPRVAGSKRKHDKTDNHAITSSAPKDRVVMRTITDPCDVKAGDVLRVTDNGMEEYHIQHFQKVGPDTGNSAVYTAFVTRHEDGPVAVKYIMGGEQVHRARIWQNEFELHRLLKCVSRSNPLTPRRD